MWREQYARLYRKHPGLRDDFHKRLRYAMERRKLRPVDVAARACVREDTVVSWLAGKYRPQHGNLAALCKALKVKAKFFTQPKEAPNEQVEA